MTRATVDAVNRLPEHNRVLRFWCRRWASPAARSSYRATSGRPARSKYPLAKMISLSLDSVTGFSTAPLRLATLPGSAARHRRARCLLYALIAARRAHRRRLDVDRVAIVRPSAPCSCSASGMLGEYIGRMYTQMQGRPSYFVAYDSLVGRGQDPDDDTPLPAVPAERPLQTAVGDKPVGDGAGADQEADAGQAATGR